MIKKQSPFWSNLFRPEKNIYDQMTEMWLKTPLFEEIKKNEVRKLCKSMHIREYKKNETIFNEGDNGIGVILILSGKVSIKAKNIVLAELDTGDFFGEVALSSKDKRAATAISDKNTKLVFFLKQDLEDWIGHSPSIAARFLLNLNKVLASRLKKANNKVSE